MKFALTISFCFSIILSAQSQFLENKVDLVKHEGFFDFYYSEEEDKIFLEVGKIDEDFLFLNILCIFAP